jgi:hypothetical protein
MANLSLPTLTEELSADELFEARTAEADGSSTAACLDLLIATFGDGAAEDYSDYVCPTADEANGSRLLVGLSPSINWHVVEAYGGAKAIVVFLKPKLTETDRRALDDMFEVAVNSQTEFIGVVSTFRVHLGDDSAADAEAHALARLKRLPARVVVFRPGHILSRNSLASTRLRRFSFNSPVIPQRFRTCCIKGEELFAAIEKERRAAASRRGTRVLTLLGPNRPWREWLWEQRTTGLMNRCLTFFCSLLSFLLIGHFVGILFSFLAWRRPKLRSWSFDTLHPGSFSELLALCNKYSYQHVKVVGYNNGVVHFGQHYPGKTIVSTTRCNRVVLREVRGGASPPCFQLKADCGATIRNAIDFLAATGKELPVVPNYSYVCLGTTFFVPIHGSASEFSTVADTITRVLLYDPSRDRLLLAARNQTDFQEYVYNLKAEVLLLRLYLRVTAKSHYFVQKTLKQKPSATDLLSDLRDSRAANVEVRKARASAKEVTVSRFFKDQGDVSFGLLELPRDKLGRLWDRLEENQVTSFLMHALTRHFAFHLELFFTDDEFKVFWETHRNLPLRKLQLRYIKRDVMPHSPFRDHDCVAVDLFMLRRHRRRFLAYLKQTFPCVRTNPGKQSR